MLSNAYFLAKFRFDTAENEPAKNLQNFANFPDFANPKETSRRRSAAQRLSGGRARARARRAMTSKYGSAAAVKPVPYFFEKWNY